MTADVRAEILGEVIYAIHQHADVIGIERGDYAANIVLGVEIVVADLADEEAPPARRVVVFTHDPSENLYTRHDLLDDADASKYRRLLAHFEAHDSQSVRRALNEWRLGGAA